MAETPNKLGLTHIFHTQNAFSELLPLAPYHFQRNQKRRVNGSVVGRDRWARRVGLGAPSGRALPKFFERKMVSKLGSFLSVTLRQAVAYFLEGG